MKKYYLLCFILVLALLVQPPQKYNTPQVESHVDAILLATLSGFESNDSVTNLDMVVGDIDNDNRDEIILCVPYGWIYVLKWNDTAQKMFILDAFKTPTGNVHHQAVAVGNVDTDPLNELVVSSDEGNIYFYKINPITGKFVEQSYLRLTNIGGKVRSIFPGELDGDMYADLAVLINGISLANRTLLIFERNANYFDLVFNGTSHIGPWFYWQTPDSMAVGYVDPDSNIEIGIVGYNGSENNNFAILEKDENNVYKLRYQNAITPCQNLLLIQTIPLVKCGRNF
ncbi:MAG: hypothetical protein QXL15_04775 [Candidatus Korarchaeota archaeon]